MHAGVPPADHGDHVAKGRRLRARDDRDRAREARQRAFARGVEQPVFFQPGLGLVEPLLPETFAVGLQRGDDELHLAARGPDGELAVRAHLQSVLDLLADPRRAPLPDHRGDLRLSVLEREVPVPARILLVAGHLSAHPELGKGALEHVLRLARECVDGERLSGGGAGVAHAPAAASWRRRAARTVLASSIAIVIRPTPPGTGEIFDATRRTSSNFTSPTIR